VVSDDYGGPNPLLMTGGDDPLVKIVETPATLSPRYPDDDVEQLVM